MTPFDVNAFRGRLSTRAIGQTVEYRQSVDTTMVVARDLAALGAPHGTLVLAEEQTAGRGRRGRSFASPAGENLYFTLILRVERDAARRLPLAVPVAVCSAIEAEGIPARIKWPNDIWIDERKASGMLIDLDEAAPGRFIAYPGVGINVNGDPTVIAELREIATSLRLVAGRPINREWLLARICENLERALEVWTAPRVADEYRVRSLVLGRRVVVSGSDAVSEGEAVAVLDDGGLQLRLDDGSIQVVAAGDVSLRPR